MLSKNYGFKLKQGQNLFWCISKIYKAIRNTSSTPEECTIHECPMKSDL